MTNSERWKIEDIENEIMEYLNNGKKVFIEAGCLNDSIISYSVNNQLTDREVMFKTSACAFPLYINLMYDVSTVDIEGDYEGNLFVIVS